MRRALVGIISTFLGLVLACEAFAEKRVALVIGNGSYAQGPLSNPPNDAELIAESLREVGFEVVAHLNSGQSTMKRAILDFGRRLEEAGKDAVGLFYYAGHGVQARGANFLIPVDSAIVREADLEIEAVEARWVLTQMKFAGNRLNMVILDACRNNPYRASFRSATRGLARMDAPSGSLVAYSAGPGNVAFDGAGRNSPYTAALAAAMKDPDLDLEDVFKAVRRKVEAKTNGAQTPWEESSLKGDFYFVPQGSTVTVTPPQAPPAFDARAVELAFWNSIEDSENGALFEEYLKRYPAGAFAAIAKVRIERLTGETNLAALPPPAEPGPDFEVRDVDDTYYARKTANLRSGPGTRFDKVGRLKPGQEVGVTGRVKNKDWLRIARADGGEAYVYAPLLGEERPGRTQEERPGKTQVAVGVYPEAPVYKPGEVFRDCPECPEMVVVPAGSFTMGSRPGEAGRFENEGPVHGVTIARPFAAGKYEVTRGEFSAFVRATGRNMGASCWVWKDGEWKDRGGGSWLDPGFSQTDRDPVVCVSWDDAKAYLRWLSVKTGQNYRLLSEAEWEYVARAGTTTAYNTGSGISQSQAKFGSKDGTVPVGSYPPNAFGLHDVHGNVWEWGEDCWNDSYSGAPSDGLAWLGGECGVRVLRGGSWFNVPWSLRSAMRFRGVTGDRNIILGFRVASTP